jgi:hypothetical protein
MDNDLDPTKRHLLSAYNPLQYQTLINNKTMNHDHQFHFFYLTAYTRSRSLTRYEIGIDAQIESRKKKRNSSIIHKS